MKHIGSQTKRLDGSAKLVSTLLVLKSLPPNDTPPVVHWAQVKVGNILHLPSALFAKDYLQLLKRAVESAASVVPFQGGGLHKSITINKLAQSNLSGMETIVSYIQRM